MTPTRRCAAPGPWLRRVPSALALALAVVFLQIPAAAAAQELAGMAIGPDGEPLVEIPVVLHRVGGGSGAFVATDTTDADGRFRFTLQAGDTAIHFAALRYEDRMYIGPAVRPDGGPVTGYTLRVEPGSEAGAVASALSGEAPFGPPARTGPAGGMGGVGSGAGGSSSDLGALLLVGLLALGTVAAFLVAAPRYRRRRTRDALIELATVENALAGPDAPKDRARLEAERDRLRQQLAPGT